MTDRSVWPFPCKLADGRTYYKLRWIDPVTDKYVVKSPKPRCFSEREAKTLADDFAKKLPPLPPRTAVGAQPVDRLTVAEIAREWRGHHPHHSTGDHIVLMATRAADQMKAEYPEQLTPKMIQDWRKAQGEVGVDRPGAYLRSILDWSRSRGQVVAAVVLDELTPPPSNEFDGPVLTDEQYLETMEAARKAGPRVYAIAKCLSTYGWRPSHACRLTIDRLDLRMDRRVVHLHRKDPAARRRGSRSKKLLPCVLFPQDAEMLLALVKDRDPSERVFLNPIGKPWYIDPKGSAIGITQWYRRHCVQRPEKDGGPIGLGCGVAYAWKRYAFHRMELGKAPWRERLGIPEMQLFSGHKTKEQVLRYLHTNERRAADLTGGDGDSWGKTG